jgi:hypothetical protein
MISLFLYKAFHVSDDFQRIFVAISFVLVLPVLYIKWVLKKPLRDFGLKIGDWKKGLMYGLLSAVILLIIFSLLFWKFDFVEKYYLPVNVIVNFKYFVLRELIVVGFFIALYEFFFRGFVMFYFLEKLSNKYYANIIQASFFYLFLVSMSTFDWARSPYIIVAPLAGLIAQKSGSIIYSAIFTWIVFLILDATFVKMIIQTTLNNQI